MQNLSLAIYEPELKDHRKPRWRIVRILPIQYAITDIDIVLGPEPANVLMGGIDVTRKNSDLP
jgi:hypothetical protein